MSSLSIISRFPNVKLPDDQEKIFTYIQNHPDTKLNPGHQPRTVELTTEIFKKLSGDLVSINCLDLDHIITQSLTKNPNFSELCKIFKIVERESLFIDPVKKALNDLVQSTHIFNHLQNHEKTKLHPGHQPRTVELINNVFQKLSNDLASTDCCDLDNVITQSLTKNPDFNELCKILKIVKRESFFIDPIKKALNDFFQ